MSESDKFKTFEIELKNYNPDADAEVPADAPVEGTKLNFADRYAEVTEEQRAEELAEKPKSKKTKAAKVPADTAPAKEVNWLMTAVYIGIALLLCAVVVLVARHSITSIDPVEAVETDTLPYTVSTTMLPMSSTEESSTQESASTTMTSTTTKKASTTTTTRRRTTKSTTKATPTPSASEVPVVSEDDSNVSETPEEPSVSQIETSESE